MTTSHRIGRQGIAQVVLALSAITVAAVGLGSTSRELGAAPEVPYIAEVEVVPDGGSRSTVVVQLEPTARAGTAARRAPARAAAGTRRPAPALPAGAVVAAADGVASAKGSIAAPVDLATALSKDGPVKPGGTVLLRGGVYRGAFTSTLIGTREAPIVVRSFPGEWAVIDGGSMKAPTVRVLGPDVHLRDFEVMKSDPDRVSSYPTNRPPDVSRSTWAGVSVDGARAKLINLVVHDNGDGIGLWRHAVDAEVYGCVVFNNGWLGSDHAWGHGIYVQNTTGTKRIENNVVFNNFGWGVHAFDATRALNGVAVDRVTSFNNGSPVGAYVPNVLAGAKRDRTDRIAVTNSVLYHRPGAGGINLQLGYPRVGGKANGVVAVHDNDVVGGYRAMVLKGWRKAHVSRNAISVAPIGRTASAIAEVVPQGDAMSTQSYVWDENAYRDANGSATQDPDSFVFGSVNRRSLTFAEWQRQTSFDRRTSYERAQASGIDVITRPNRYQSGRAFVTVLNRSGARAVSLDLSDAKLAIGRPFAIYDVQDLGGPPLLSGVHNGKKVSVPMDLTAVASPVGKEPRTVTHTGRDFGVFMVVALPEVTTS